MKWLKFGQIDDHSFDRSECCTFVFLHVSTPELREVLWRQMIQFDEEELDWSWPQPDRTLLGGSKPNAESQNFTTNIRVWGSQLENSQRFQ